MAEGTVRLCWGWDPESDGTLQWLAFPEVEPLLRLWSEGHAAEKKGRPENVFLCGFEHGRLYAKRCPKARAWKKWGLSWSLLQEPVVMTRDC